MAIYVWGTGCGASELIEAGFDRERIKAFVDSFPSGETFLGKPVILPEKLDAGDCELLIISARQSAEISARCRELGIERDKLLFLKNNYELRDINRHCSGTELLGSEILEKLLPVNHVVKTPPALRESVFSRDELANDYVRLATLELICRRLGDVPGEAAELGVYKGFFARHINRLLPRRKLYLFDSFEGFEQSARASESFQAAHRNTAADTVLSRLPFPEKAVIMPGFFPDSLKGLEEHFCFVSLDVDFYQATLDGLRYFWPRLSRGGCIMLHDWGNPALPQVAQALAQYEAEHGLPIAAVPLCDLGGTLVLTKS